MIVSPDWENASLSMSAKKIKFIRQNPKVVAIRYKDTRTALLDTFPYMIHFTIDENQKLVIVSAVLSTHRDPDLWAERD